MADVVNDFTHPRLGLDVGYCADDLLVEHGIVLSVCRFEVRDHRWDKFVLPVGKWCGFVGKAGKHRLFLVVPGLFLGLVHLHSGKVVDVITGVGFLALFLVDLRHTVENGLAGELGNGVAQGANLLD